MIQGIFAILNTVLGRIFPNPEDELKRLQIQKEMQLEIAAREAEIQKMALEVVKTEAGSQFWLTANWRPLLMLTFAGLIVARMFGWTAPQVTEAEYLQLWDIIQLGIGGYVIGRSVEKVAPTIVEAFKK